MERLTDARLAPAGRPIRCTGRLKASCVWLCGLQREGKNTMQIHEEKAVGRDRGCTAPPGMRDPYRKCPVFETPHFTLRLVRMEDAEDLLRCYADPKAQPFFNADGCTSDFCFHTPDEMKECIAFFLRSYDKRDFIRFAVVDRAAQRVVGTVEIFDTGGRLAGCGACGVLRIDFWSPYETQEAIGEILALSNASFYSLAGVSRIVTKAVPCAKARIAALRTAGFSPFDWEAPGRGHYWARSLE